jgi:hypothetical protein
MTLHASLEINVLTKLKMQFSFEVRSLLTHKLGAKRGAGVFDDRFSHRITDLRGQLRRLGTRGPLNRLSPLTTSKANQRYPETRKVAC